MAIRHTDMLSPTWNAEKKAAAGSLKQRPVQILKKSTVARSTVKHEIVKSSKLESKSMKNDPDIVKGKAEVVDTSLSVTPRINPEVKKQEEEKKLAAPAAVDTEPRGNYELNERMTRMVETELRDIMIKVWQELPDNPSDAAERVVVDKLRNKASDDLRNVLGLNITKRLLNIHNPLYVKVQFSGKPEKVHLGEFLKKYNFIAFKRIENTVNMFAALVKTIADFDKICTEKEVRCGNIKVLINPIYKFTKCPPNLITSFSDYDDNANSDTAIDITEKDLKCDKNDEPVKSQPLTKQSENVPKTKVSAKTESVAKASDVAIDTKETNKTIEKNIVTSNLTSIVKSCNENKPGNKPITETKTPVNKPIDVKNAVGKPAIENKVIVKQATENKITDLSDKSNKNVTNKVEMPTIVNKTAVQKATLENNEVKKQQINIKNITTTVKKQVPTPIKTQTIKSEAKQDSHRIEKVARKSKVDNDYDELDDHDILALMSEGIVLDECSGSDDE